MIPVNKPQIPAKAQAYLTECVNSGWFSAEGPFVKKFETAFAKYVGVKYALVVNSGTTALHLALLSLGIGKGDEVILPASTIASCYFAIWYTGAKAVPVDVDPETYTINPKEIKKHLTSKTKAIMVVHLFGHPCEMDPINKIAKKHKLFVIEDAAEAHGATYQKQPVGSLGDVACFSFYSNKIVSCGEGGMVLTNDESLYKKAAALANLNHTPEKRFVHAGIGYRYTMTNMQAGLALASFEEIKSSIKYKRQMAKRYHQLLGKIPGLILPVEKEWAKNVYWMYSIRVVKKDFGYSRDELMKMLMEKYKIQTRSFFYPPKVAFKAMRLFQKESFPIAERIGEEGLYLPSGLGNSMDEFEAVAVAIRQIYQSQD